MCKNLLFGFLFLILLQLVSPKLHSDGVNFSNFNRKGGVTMTKFGLAPGTGNFEIRVKTEKMVSKSVVPLEIFLFSEKNWDKVKDNNNCEDRKKYAEGVLAIDVPTDGTWSSYASGNIIQPDPEASVWYFMLNDCKGSASRLHVIGNRYKWEVLVRNSDGSHFSEEENGLIKLNIFVFVLTLLFLVSITQKFVRYNREEGSIDYPVMILLFVVACEMLAAFCELFHLIIYAVDGQGVFFFDMSNQALTVLAQFLVTCLLLLMAYGWSVEHLEFDDMDIFIPLAVLFGILHMLIILLSRLTDSETNKYHDYENWAGIVILIIRILLFIFWVYLYVSTFQKAKGLKRDFYKQLGVLSIIYLLSYPAILFISASFVSPWNRHKFVTIGTVMLQTLTIAVLTLLFTTTKTKYYSISIKGRMVLPTNKNHLFQGMQYVLVS